jgi:hypothetical protein
MIIVLLCEFAMQQWFVDFAYEQIYASINGTI